MRRKIDYIATFLLLILGSAHIILTPLFYKTFDLNTLWFAGTGMAFVFLGVINIIRIKSSERFVKRICLLGNALAFIFCVLIVTKMSGPQAYISLIDLLVLLGLSVVDLRFSKNIN